jgi:hypothetical protein
LSTITKPVEEQQTKVQQNSLLPSHHSTTIEGPASKPRVSSKEEQQCGMSTSHGHHSEPSVQPKLSKKSGLTRTSRKAYFEEKKSPFASFGWNDSERNIGQKKTYNVYAPESEVCLLHNCFIAI